MINNNRNYFLIILIINILCFIHISCLTYPSKPSQVDISSLEILVNYPMYNLDELKVRLNKLESKDGIRKFDNHEWRGDVGRTWVYSYYTTNVDGVYIWIYDNSDNAKNNFEKWTKNNHRGLRKKIIKISEVVEVILWDSDSIHGEFNYYIYDVIYTSIKIGNMVINLDERFYRNETIANGTQTTENIKMICKVLME